MMIFQDQLSKKNMKSKIVHTERLLFLMDPKHVKHKESLLEEQQLKRGFLACKH